MRVSLAGYSALKAVNFVLIAAWGLAFVYALIREVDLDDYAQVALIGAMASYVLGSDLGFSAVLYNSIRRSFLGGNTSAEHGLFSFSLLAYALVSTLAVGIFGIYLLITNDASRISSLVWLLFFLNGVLALPWILLRVGAAAIDRHFQIEFLEFFRRTANLVLVGALLSRLDFESYVYWSLAVWAAAYFAAAIIAGPLLDFSRGALRAALGLFSTRMAQIGNAMAFSLAETFIYLSPYAVMALAYGPRAVAAFDVFYRIVRFGASAFLACSEASLPLQTRLAHDGNLRRLGAVQTVTLSVGALPMAAGVVAVAPLGELTFNWLLGDASLISPALRTSMAIMLMAMLPQTIAGSFLLNTGRTRPLVVISLTMVVIMGTLGLGALTQHLSQDAFILAYALLFAFGAAAYSATLVLLVHLRLPQGNVT